jgi:hypothetical protein
MGCFEHLGEDLQRRVEGVEGTHACLLVVAQMHAGT